METMTLYWFFAKCWTMLDEKFEQNQTWSNIIQHNATISNMVFKRTQHVGHNNVGWCWYNMLHPFKQAFKLSGVIFTTSAGTDRASIYTKVIVYLPWRQAV
jgi:hypothetical protein